MNLRLRRAKSSNSSRGSGFGGGGSRRASGGSPATVRRELVQRAREVASEKTWGASGRPARGGPVGRRRLPSAGRTRRRKAGHRPSSGCAAVGWGCRHERCGTPLPTVAYHIVPQAHPHHYELAGHCRRRSTRLKVVSVALRSIRLLQSSIRSPASSPVPPAGSSSSAEKPPNWGLICVRDRCPRGAERQLSCVASDLL